MKRSFRILGASLALALFASSQAQENILATLNARNVGPTTMGGRVSDIAVYEKEPRIFYVATASGGLWKTENGGMTMTCVWDKGTTVAMGAVDVSQKDPNLVWIGTGEQNGRNSASYGDGVYKSTDGGKTWEKMGLEKTRHIAQVIIDPKDNNIVYVAACGRLWGTNPERGLYKTTDGGKTWDHILKWDDKTGLIDLVMDPSDNRTLLAAGYERQRWPWNYVGGGPNSGIYKSTDAGKTWRRITKGLPEGTMGRIGLDFYRKDPRKMVAQVEASKPNAAGTGDPTPTGGIYVSEDKGETWTMQSQRRFRWFYFTIPRWDPVDENRIYFPDASMFVSDDKGKTVRGFRMSVHVDHHAMWINPADNNHIIVGEDGGVGQSRDRGRTWEHINYMPIGQYYAVGFDMQKPYRLYGGLQDNGTWGGPTQTARGGIAFWDWDNINGGDGFYARVDPDEWRYVYAESQGGAASRLDLVTGQRQSLRPPQPPQGEPRYRFNWNTPIELSPHNPRIVYVGGNRLFRSLNRGENMVPISPDLTNNDPDKQKVGVGSVTPDRTGAETHCTIVTIGESPLKAGVIWCGTDDGNVQVTQDFGTTWTNVAGNIPDAPRFGWVTRVSPSRHAAGRCYVTYANYRMDDDKTYVFVTEDYGKTWSKLNGNLPEMEPCHVIREGLRNPDLLFLGTEFGLYVSLNRGTSWTKFRSNFPTVSVHDVAIHPRELDLCIATHGRSLWTLNVSALEELTPAVMNENDLYLSKPQTVYYLGRMAGGMGFDGDRIWSAPNTQPGTDICYYLKADGTGESAITITDAAGTSIATLSGPVKAGLNVVRWRAGNRRLTEGDLKVTVKVGAFEKSSTIKVEDISEKISRGEE